MANYLGRGIHKEKFLKSLKEGFLSNMLKEIINDNDNVLDLQIRQNYLNIYYKGGRIAKVNSENSVEFDKFYFYLGMPKIPKKKIENDKEKLAELTKRRDSLVLKFKNQNYESYFKEAKEVMKKWFFINPKPERDEQHNLSIFNQYGKSDYTIIDIEYQVSILSDFHCIYKGKKPRFDIIAINKSGELCVIELKKGIGALKATSGLKEHWECYKHSIGRLPQSFVKEMKFILKQKQDFGLIDKQLEIKSDIPKFMFAYAYDDKYNDETQNHIFDEEYNKINENIPVIKLKKGSYKLLN